MIKLYYSITFDWLYIVQPDGKVLRGKKDGSFEPSGLWPGFFVDAHNIEFLGNL